MNHPPIRDIYSRRLLEEGKINEAEFEGMQQICRDRLEKAMALAKEGRPKQRITTLGGIWKGMQRAGDDWTAKTNIPMDVVRTIGQRGTSYPEGFNVHPKLKRLLSLRRDMTEGKAPIDWATGELLALGSLLLEGTPIRFVGQDAQRGTFGHRHACLHDYETGQKYYPLANLSDKQAPVIVVNTMLSELAVVGFEYGFSSADPRNLVVWEAQFGDFMNMAQPMLDQFIVAAESKWQKMSGLVMLLPHGYEGQGPEHSNAYIERFLSLCADENIQVCYPTLPSQYFHLLRRQMHRNFRKPLVVFTPKSMLRMEAATSQLEEFTEGTYQLVIDDPAGPKPQRVDRILLCTGKIFYVLDAARKEHKIDDVAIVRVEQLYPYPQKEIQAILQRYRNAAEICWVQEEPMNRGAWTFMRDRLAQMLPETAVLTYCGRDEAASPATGSYKVHAAEEKEIISHALELNIERPKKAELVSAQVASPRTVEAKATPVSD